MIQQALYPFRRGLMGNLPLDAAYLRGVEARARMLAKACRVNKVGWVEERNPTVNHLNLAPGATIPSW